MNTRTPLRASGPGTSRPQDVAPSPLLDRLAHVLATTQDLSASSDALALAASTWEESYHLSPQRGNILRALPLPESPVVLEIGARCGGLTRHLGELGGTVDALEPHHGMAQVARARCADLTSVVVHEATLDDVPLETTYDLVVAVDASDLLASQGLTTADLAERATALLRPGGLLLIAGDNPRGVRFQAGDSTPTIGRDGGAPLARLHQADVESAVRAAGLEPRSLLAFPDHRHTQLLFDHDALAAIDSQLLLALPSFPSPPYLDRPATFPEEHLWAAAVEAGTGAQHANAYVVLAGTAPAPVNAAASFWTVGRRAAQSAFNRIRQRGDELVVERALAFPGSLAPDGPLSIRPHTEAFVAGATLTRRLGSAASIDEARALLRGWRDLVIASCHEGEPVPWDLIPRNVVVTDDQRLVAIDQEWQLDGGDAEVILTRGCFWLTYDVAIARRPPSWLPVTGTTDVAALADLIADLAGCQLSAGWVDRLIDREAQHMSHVWPTDDRHSRAARARKEWHQLTDLSRTPPQTDGPTETTEPVSSEAFSTVVEALSSTNAALQQQVRDLELELRHAELIHRDHAIGLMATAEKLRDRHEMSQSSLRRARAKMSRLQKRNAAMKASATWRVGSFFVRPFNRLRRR
ncbi:methyltransferase [Aeromicrobium fastidiosum]|nr:class I SAM-dependent methyltransferase [Aeromicrobium fastidiosum]MBP2389231.1 SAM-dependent methyltransferase [Aeromicrobium fastidiosum]